MERKKHVAIDWTTIWPLMNESERKASSYKCPGYYLPSTPWPDQIVQRETDVERQSLRETERERAGEIVHLLRLICADRASWAPFELSCGNKHPSRHTQCAHSTLSHLTLTPKMNTFPIATLSAWAVIYSSIPLFCSISLNYQYECSLPAYRDNELPSVFFCSADSAAFQMEGRQRLDINYWWVDEAVLSSSLCSDFFIIWRWDRLAAIHLIQLLPQQGQLWASQAFTHSLQERALASWSGPWLPVATSNWE